MLSVPTRLDVDARQSGECIRVESSSVHDGSGGDTLALTLALPELESIASGAPGDLTHLAREEDERTVRLGLGGERERERVGIYDARARGEQAQASANCWLELRHTTAVDQLEPGGTIRLTSISQRFEDRNLGGLGGDHELARPAMRDPKSRAAFGEELATPYAQTGLERPQWIVETGVEHLAAAAGDTTSDALASLEHEHRTTRPSERRRAGEAHDASPHHRDVHLGGHRWAYALGAEARNNEKKACRRSAPPKEINPRKIAT
jgi:hypothetical protein